MMNENLEKTKKSLETKNPNTVSEFEIYKSYFPDLEQETFNTLKKCGCLGRFFRGKRIDLIKENIHIPVCLKMYDAFLDTRQYVPCVIKSKNPYWNAKTTSPYFSF